MHKNANKNAYNSMHHSLWKQIQQCIIINILRNLLSFLFYHRALLQIMKVLSLA